MKDIIYPLVVTIFVMVLGAWGLEEFINNNWLSILCFVISIIVFWFVYSWHYNNYKWQSLNELKNFKKLFPFISLSLIFLSTIFIFFILVLLSYIFVKQDLPTVKIAIITLVIILIIIILQTLFKSKEKYKLYLTLFYTNSLSFIGSIGILFFGFFSFSQIYGKNMIYMGIMGILLSFIILFQIKQGNNLHWSLKKKLELNINRIKPTILIGSFLIIIIISLFLSFVLGPKIVLNSSEISEYHLNYKYGGTDCQEYIVSNFEVEKLGNTGWIPLDLSNIDQISEINIEYNSSKKEFIFNGQKIVNQVEFINFDPTNGLLYYNREYLKEANISKIILEGTKSCSLENNNFIQSKYIKKTEEAHFVEVLINNPMNKIIRWPTGFYLLEEGTINLKYCDILEVEGTDYSYDGNERDFVKNCKEQLEKENVCELDEYSFYIYFEDSRHNRLEASSVRINENSSVNMIFKLDCSS